MAMTIHSPLLTILLILNQFFKYLNFIGLKDIKVPGGTRTHNLEIRSLARYPLRHEDRTLNLLMPLLGAGFTLDINSKSIF